MHIRRTGVAGVALVGLLASACAGSAGIEVDDAGPGDVPARVQVTNNNWLDVNVYAVWSGTRARLGTVGSNSTRTFTVPRTMAAHGTIQLLAAPIGSPSVHRTEAILLDGGDRIELNVENSLSLSSYTVRSRRR